MALKPYFDADLGQEIIETTGGVVVEYEGKKAFMHMERPTIDVMSAFSDRVHGIAQILVGQRVSFEGLLTRQTPITVAGEEWTVGDFGHPGDSEVLIIALTKSTRS